jgi:hypothetical protein
MVVYADILFAINFSMDFFSLFLSSLILHRKISKKRIIIASLIGAIYGVFDVVLFYNTLLSVISCIIVSIVMCLIVFRLKNLKGFIIANIMYWGVSAGLGGLMSLIYSLLNKIFSEFLESTQKSEAYNGARFFVIASITAIISLIVSRIFTSKKDLKASEIKVIYEDGTEKTVKRGVCFSVYDEGDTVKVSYDGVAGSEEDEIAVLAIVAGIAKEMGINDDIISKVEKCDE